MEKYIVSRELAEQLKAAGYPQSEDGRPTTYFVWTTWMEDETEVRAGKDTYGSYIAAPLSDELLEQLPLLDIERKSYGVKIVQSLVGSGYLVMYWHKSVAPTSVYEDQFAIGEAQKLPDALAQLWLWCKEQRYLAADRFEQDSSKEVEA